MDKAINSLREKKKDYLLTEKPITHELKIPDRMNVICKSDQKKRSRK